MNMIDEMLLDYSGGMTVKEVSEKHRMAAGKAFYMLRDAGCSFRSKGTPKGYKHTLKALEAIRQGAKKRIKTEKDIEWARTMGKANACDYNGLNGYGHTKRHNQGYVLVYVPHHPNAHKDGYSMLHTVILERSIGRYLKKDEVAHHINGVKNDNNVSNLKLMKIKEHQSMHMKQRYQKRRDALSTSW